MVCWCSANCLRVFSRNGFQIRNELAEGCNSCIKTLSAISRFSRFLAYFTNLHSSPRRVLLSGLHDVSRFAMRYTSQPEVRHLVALCEIRCWFHWLFCQQRYKGLLSQVMEFSFSQLFELKGFNRGPFVVKYPFYSNFKINTISLFVASTAVCPVSVVRLCKAR